MEKNKGKAESRLTGLPKSQNCFLWLLKGLQGDLRLNLSGFSEITKPLGWLAYLQTFYWMFCDFNDVFFSPPKKNPFFGQALFILYTGLCWTLNSNHGFSTYVLGNMLYVIFLILGLRRKACCLNKTFWNLKHFDWIIVSIATVIMMVTYHHPEA